MKPTIVFRPAPLLKILFVPILVSALLGRTTTSWAQTATTTTLTVSPSSSPAAPLQPRTVVTLTATVTAGGAAVYPVRVTFCEATTAANCRFLAVLGTAQLTTAGTAAIKFVPGGGSHSYIAVFARTTTPIAYTTSTSTPQSVTVSPAIPYPTATTIASTGSTGNYTLTATVVGTGNDTAGPTGSVTFVDTTNGNHVLGTASLGRQRRRRALSMLQDHR